MHTVTQVSRSKNSFFYLTIFCPIPDVKKSVSLIFDTYLRCLIPASTACKKATEQKKKVHTICFGLPCPCEGPDDIDQHQIVDEAIQ